MEQRIRIQISGSSGLKKQTVKKSLPVGVVLTLAAAGSETSDSAVLTNEETKIKRGLSTDFNRPAFAIMNPELTYTITKVSGRMRHCGYYDAYNGTLSTADEGTYLTDGIAEGVMRAAAQAGLDCIRDPENYEARAI